MPGKKQYHVVDVVVFGITVIVSIGIGIYYALSGGRQRTTSEFLVGGRLISFLPVAISLMVSFESSIMMLGLPAEGYVYGGQYFVAFMGFLVANVMSIYIVVPLLHPLKITSAYEYLEYRFQSKAVRMFGTYIGMMAYCFYMGIVLFGPAVALEAVTGFPKWTSIVTISMVAVIYTSIGGIKAVIWTDVFQAFIMFSGIFAVLIKGTMEVGGPKQVWDVARKGGRLDVFQFDPDPRTRHTFYNLFFTTIIRGFGLAFNQSTVQRISSTKTLYEAKKVMMFVAPSFTLSCIISMYEGTVAYAYYQTQGCDPFESEQLENSNQIVPFFVFDIFKDWPGMPGLFLAALFSASLSTLSSGLSSMSAIFWTDIAHPLIGDVSDFKGAIITKLSVLCFGLLACGLAFLVSMIGGTLIQIASSMLSAFAGPSTGLFLLGCFCHRATAKGALVGGTIGFFLSCWISFGINFSPLIPETPWLPPASTDQCSVILGENFTSTITNMSTMYSTTTQRTTTEQMPEPTGIAVLYTMSYTFIGPIGILSTILLGYIVSLITGPNKPGDVDPRYLLSFSEFILMPFPERFKKWVSSFGAQFMLEEYKAKFPDPALKEKKTDKELTILDPNSKMAAPDGSNAEEPLLLLQDKRDNNGCRLVGSGGDGGGDGGDTDDLSAILISCNNENENNNSNNSNNSSNNSSNNNSNNNSNNKGAGLSSFSHVEDSADDTTTTTSHPDDVTTIVAAVVNDDVVVVAGDVSVVREDDHNLSAGTARKDQ